MNFITLNGERQEKNSQVERYQLMWLSVSDGNQIKFTTWLHYYYFFSLSLSLNMCVCMFVWLCLHAVTMYVISLVTRECIIYSNLMKVFK